MPILSSIIEKDIAIDLGTDTTILYVAGIGGDDTLVFVIDIISTR